MVLLCVDVPVVTEAEVTVKSAITGVPTGLLFWITGPVEEYVA